MARRERGANWRLAPVQSATRVGGHQQGNSRDKGDPAVDGPAKLSRHETTGEHVDSLEEPGAAHEHQERAEGVQREFQSWPTWELSFILGFVLTPWRTAASLRAGRIHGGHPGRRPAAPLTSSARQSFDCQDSLLNLCALLLELGDHLRNVHVIWIIAHPHAAGEAGILEQLAKPLFLAGVGEVQ